MSQKTKYSNKKIPMPQILYGTAWKKERTAELVERAILCGFRGIDTACQPKHYHEAGVGDALRNLAARGISRDKLFLQTKFTPRGGQDPQRIPYNPNALIADQVQQSFSRSTINLGVDFIDSLVLHSPLENFDETLIAWRSMETIVDRGDVGQIGISNCYDLDFFTGLYEKATIKPSILQNRFYKESGYDRELRAFCKDHGILYQSFWTLTANPQILAHQATQSASRKYNKTPEQILFRYLIHNGVCPLTGTCSEDHMRDDLDIFRFSLEASEVEAIDRILG